MDIWFRMADIFCGLFNLIILFIQSGLGGLGFWFLWVLFCGHTFADLEIRLNNTHIFRM